jgi:NitT/TauT family transport system substrate-binding protein
MSRNVRHAVALVAIAALAALALAGCTAAPGVPGSDQPHSGAVTPSPIRIGTLTTEDALPLWVAEKQGYFAKAGLDVTITVFQSAQERDTALTAGAIDGEMGDLIAVGTLRSGGVPVRATTIMLGATPKEGRFGIAVKPGSTATSLKDLAGVPVGTSSATIQEYVLDGLMKEAGVPDDQIKKEEVKKVPVRFELLMQGQLAAAALPEPFLSLAEKQGAKIVGDDTKSKTNLSQTVLIFSEKYLNTPGGAAAVTKLLSVWDEGAAAINKDPEAYRALLIDKARLPKPVESTYVMQTYPKHQLPTTADLDAIISWMKTKGLIKSTVSAADMVWMPTK